MCDKCQGTRLIVPGVVCSRPAPAKQTADNDDGESLSLMYYDSLDRPLQRHPGVISYIGSL